MKIAIYGKPGSNNVNAAVPELIGQLNQYGFTFEIYERYAAYLTENGYLKEMPITFNRENADITKYALLISIGGDGTLLDTVTLIGASGVPIIGLNAGRLGFISGLDKHEIADVLIALKSGKIHCDYRSLLTVKSQRGLFDLQNFALNEITVHKKDTSAMVRIDTWIDNDFLSTYWADGLIVSTPTGSSAYSLSCGGPILMPNADNIVITPIAPHNLNIRPVVVSSRSVIKVRVSGRSENFLITADSRSEILLPNEDIIITKAPFQIGLLQPDGHTFANTLRNKLGWGMDKRN